jgi:four helix bundle protein
MSAPPRPYSLDERTELFAKEVRGFVKRLPRSTANTEDVRQLVKSSGSVGANYIEANEALSKKDFAMRIRISRKEAKESGYWLRLLDTGPDPTVDAERHRLNSEAGELVKIFTAILTKST